MKLSEAQTDRYWQNWDCGEAAKRIDEYWLECEQGCRETEAAELEAQFGKGVRLLEVGCGSGLYYSALLKRGIVTPSSYHAGDVSRKMLEIARRRFPGVSFRELDVLKLDVADKSEPNVMCMHVIQHLPHYEEALRELMRITSRTLVVASWFNLGGEDEKKFSEPSERWDGQRFQNNFYSLPKFLSFIVQNAGAIAELNVRHGGGANYTVTIHFVPKQCQPPSLLRRIARKLGCQG